MKAKQLMAILSEYDPEQDLIAIVYDISDVDVDLTPAQWSRVVGQVDRRNEYILTDLNDLIHDSVIGVIKDAK